MKIYNYNYIKKMHFWHTSHTPHHTTLWRRFYHQKYRSILTVRTDGPGATVMGVPYNYNYRELVRHCCSNVSSSPHNETFSPWDHENEDKGWMPFWILDMTTAEELE